MRGLDVVQMFVALGAVTACSADISSDLERPSAITGSDAATALCAAAPLPSDTSWVQPGYTVRQNRRWFLKEDAPLVGPAPNLELEFSEPAEMEPFWTTVSCVRGYLQPQGGGALIPVGVAAVAAGSSLLHQVSFALNVEARQPGRYDLLIVAGDQTTTFERVPVNISAPLYMIMSVDWDLPTYGGSNGALLAALDAMRARAGASQLWMTHYVGAYMFDGVRGDARDLDIHRWLLDAQYGAGDEIGVHVHGWVNELMNMTALPQCCRTNSCSNVGTSTQCSGPPNPQCCDDDSCAPGTTCQTIPARVSAENVWQAGADEGGYSTILERYSRPELVALLDYSSRVLVKHGFVQPRSFRAGGWSGGQNLLGALAATGSYSLSGGTLLRSASEQGFLTDSSSVWSTPLLGAPGLYQFLSSPQSLSSNYGGDVMPEAPPYEWSDSAGRRVLEVPDNGVLLDYRTYEQAVADTYQLYDGTPLSRVKVYHYGLHPHTFSVPELQVRMGQTIDALNSISYLLDAGPAIWTSPLRLAWRTAAYSAEPVPKVR